jgi:hypothetical protein
LPAAQTRVRLDVAAPLPGGAVALGAAILHGVLAAALLIALFGSGRAQTEL